MAGNASRVPAIDAAQTACALIGLTLGVIPLVQRIAGARQGVVFGWLFGEVRDPYTYLTPLFVLAVVIVLVAALEWVKKR